MSQLCYPISILVSCKIFTSYSSPKEISSRWGIVSYLNEKKIFSQLSGKRTGELFSYCIFFSNLVRPKKKSYFGHVALIIRGDKLPTFHRPKSALNIKGKCDHHRTKLEEKK